MILIAGGTGRLGTVLGTRPTQRGLPVRVLTRDPARAAHLTGLAVEVVTGDVRDPASLAAAVHGADVVVSAVQGFAGPRGVSPVTVDARGNGNLIDATRQTGAHFVLMSAVGAAAGSPMELFRMKHPAEQHLQASGGGWTIVRATAFIEPWIAVLSQTTARSGRPVVFGRGNNPINFVSVTDVAALVERAVTDRATRGRILEIGGPPTSPSTSLPPRSRQPTGEPAQRATCPHPYRGSSPEPSPRSNPKSAARPAPPSPWIASTSPTTRPPSTRPTPACPARPSSASACSRSAQRLKTHGHAPAGIRFRRWADVKTMSGTTRPVIVLTAWAVYVKPDLSTLVVDLGLTGLRNVVGIDTVRNVIPRLKVPLLFKSRPRAPQPSQGRARGDDERSRL
jgi:NADH dehydrogenase